MKNSVLTCIAISTIAAAVMAAGCATKYFSDTQFKGVPYSGGDVCEWAKQNLVATQSAYNNDELGKYAGKLLERAQQTATSACTGEKKDSAWACAEGHSCK